MISYIEGKLIEKTPTYAIIDCAGVGYSLNISLNTYSKITDDKICKLYAYLSIKEDAHTLFGFYEQSEKQLFLNLISVSGVGAGTARMILSSLTPPEIHTAISSGNVATLQKIKGIGLKSAQRIIVDLRDKFIKEGFTSEILTPENNKVKEEALSALLMLGFAKNTAEKALERVIKIDGENLLVEQLIKGALKFL
jgi:Holliday junction DNA helicase RuvA